MPTEKNVAVISLPAERASIRAAAAHHERQLGPDNETTLPSRRRLLPENHGWKNARANLQEFVH